MDNKPLILSDDMSLVEHDLQNVYRHFKSKKTDDCATAFDVKFKKKEDMGGLSKAILKHRIQNLTGKSLSVMESEMGKPFDTVQDVRKLAKLLLLEAFGKLPHLPEEPAIGKVAVVNDRKRPLEKEIEEPAPRARYNRKSIAVATASYESPVKRPRRSELPSRKVEPAPEPMDAEEEEEEDSPDCADDIADLGLGPNPTPQMVALKRKSMAAAGKKVRTPAKSPPKKVAVKVAQPVVKKPVVIPPKDCFPGDKNSSLFMVNANLGDKKIGHLEFTKVQNLVGPSFQGANLTFLHTPVEWTPTDVFALVMNVKLLNKKANLSSFLVLIGCGVSNVNLFRDALFRHTRHVQLVVFENEQMNRNAASNETMLRDTTALFLLAYFFPGCEDENTLPPSRMTRPDVTTCFRTKSAEDLENTVIHTFSEEGDWVFDVCCKGRELTLAAQKSGRNAVAFEDDVDLLEELAEKARAIAVHHDAKFRPEVDGRILTL